MTWPKQYGGHERTFLERYVVTEEMLAHRAPTRAFSTADRQSGPMILRYGQQEIKDTILPPHRLAANSASASASVEPNSGSDVFAASTRATKTDGGWLVNGRKIWTSNAHNSDYMIALLRTSPPTKENRRHGLTQFLIDLQDRPGITIRPIINLTGQHDFNEIFFDDVFVPDLHLIGEVDMAWKQATDELAYERSGPDRWLETFSVLAGAGAPRRPRARRASRRRASAARSRIWPRCAACRSASPACCRPAKRRGSRPPSSRISARTGSRPCRTRRACWRPPTGDSAPGQQRRPLRGGAAPHHPDRPESDDPGRHPRSPARHHRPRLGTAIVNSLIAKDAKACAKDAKGHLGLASSAHPSRTLRVKRSFQDGIRWNARSSPPPRRRTASSLSARRPTDSLRGRLTQAAGRARLSRPRLSGDAQPEGGARAPGLRHGRRHSGGGRSRGDPGAGGACRLDDRAMRRARHQGGGRHQLGFRRGEKRGSGGARHGAARYRPAHRHGHRRAEFGGPRQPAAAAGRDLQPGVPRPHRAAPAGRQPRQADRGQLPVAAR